MNTFGINAYKIMELYDICRSHKIKGYKKMSKKDIFIMLKNKNLLFNGDLELKPGNSLYYVLWFSDKPIMYSFTSYYKGMDFSSYDEKTIKKYDSDFVWNETDNSPKTIYVTNSERDKDPNVHFFGRYPSCEDNKFNDYLKFKKLKTNLFYLNKRSNLGYMFNYMKDGCSLEVKFTHTLYDKDHIRKNGRDKLVVICKTKYWFKKNQFLEDEDGNFPQWALTERFNKKVHDLFGHIGYLCMIEEIKDQYGKFIKETELTGRNYKVEYSYRFIPKGIFSCITNIRTNKDVVQCEYTDNLGKLLKNWTTKDIEHYIYQWKD